MGSLKGYWGLGHNGNEKSSRRSFTHWIRTFSYSHLRFHFILFKVQLSFAFYNKIKKSQIDIGGVIWMTKKEDTMNLGCGI
jgi:hypothetical protein